MVQVIWTPLAQEDVACIFRYYEKFSSRFAQRIVEEIIHEANGLENMPELGTLEPLLKHLRRVSFGRYSLVTHS